MGASRVTVNKSKSSLSKSSAGMMQDFYRYQLRIEPFAASFRLFLAKLRMQVSDLCIVLSSCANNSPISLRVMTSLRANT